ncbi:MAG: TIGR03936 family radical SAM-associated protein [Planctomycetota bacterium]
MHIVASNETMLLVIKFKIGGALRFLSHAETLTLFQRACVRAGIGIRYSQGFNPRPKLSLPLPRPVGVVSDDELLCLRVAGAPDEPRATNHESRIKAELSAQLPEGCELVSVGAAQAGESFQPCSAAYVLAVRAEYLDEKLKATIGRLLASESLNVRRRIDGKNARLKNLDVRGFLKSIELDDRGIIIECKIGPAGSIRVGEILKLLELDEGKLAAPIRRTNVQWQVSES